MVESIDNINCKLPRTSDEQESSRIETDRYNDAVQYDTSKRVSTVADCVGVNA